MKKVRSSNFELLRLFAMFLIVIFHIVLHWPKEQIVNTELQSIYNNGLFNCPVFYNKVAIINAIMPLGRVGDGLFVMISGYFLGNKSEIDFFKISKKLLSQMAFVIIIMLIVSGMVSSLSNNNVVLSEVSYFNTEWWFVGYYYVVVILGAIIINKILINGDQKKALAVLAAMFTVVELDWSGYFIDSIAGGLRTLVIGVFFYMLGGYIHKYNPFDEIRGYVFVLGVVISNMLYYCNYYNQTLNSIREYVRNGAEETYIQSIIMPETYEILVVVMVICIFELFRRIRMPSSKVINYLGSATFMIYMIHENPFYRTIYNQTDIITVLYNSVYDFVGELIKWIGIIFGSGVAIYVLYDLFLSFLRRSRCLFKKE